MTEESTVFERFDNRLYAVANKFFGWRYITTGLLVTGVLLGWTLAAITYHIV